MSSATSSGNVIDLGQTGRAAAARVVAHLRGTAIKRISATSNALFESVDDALFDMAERAASNVNQARFFDGMREIRKKRQAMDARFQEVVARYFTDFEAGKLAPSSDEVRSGSEGKGDRLALVEESELEESLAVTAMVDKAHARLVRPLFALSQRFASLAGGRKVDHANNPLGPRILCSAFVEAIRDVEVDLQVKLIVLKLFERHVLANLEPVYDEVNAMMVQAGVLPELRYHVARERNESTPRPRPAPTERPAEGAQHFDTPEAFQREEAEIEGLVTELRGLLAARRAHHVVPHAGGSASAASSAAPARALGAQELLNALALMQNEILGQLPAATPHLVPAPVRAGEVKNDLLRQISRLGLSGSHGPHLGGNEDTIDLVGMLFEYAIQDRNLPAPIQALLGRLQIPYLKVALLDQNFVAHKNHPARRLLDELAQSCVGWSEESDRDQRLFGKVNDVVNTLLKDFDDDLSIFERLSDDFTDFVDKNRRRSELAERRTAEAARGRERLEAAQRTAARAILSHIGGRELPPMVRDLLTRRWSNYLVLTNLRHGEESQEWRNAVRFVEDFAWSVQPLNDNADRARLRERTPELERLLKQGLAATGFHQSHVDELWNEVSALYGRQLDQNAPPAPVAAAAAAAAENDVDGLTIRFATSKVGEEIVFDHASAIAEPEMDISAASKALETWIKIARALKTGTWFEFIKDDGSRERAKLLWISTIRALYLFVNRNGIKIAEKTANELAEELKTQRAVVLEQVALVDRALDAILQKLRTGPEGSAAPDDAAATPAAPAADSAAAASEAPPASH